MTRYGPTWDIRDWSMSQIGSFLADRFSARIITSQAHDDLRAGLNASESPPPEAIAGIRARHSFNDGRLQQADLCPSEDHRADLHALFDVVGVGDASESGQPPEASDE